MINFRIVALDPGGTTGWATYSACRMWNEDLSEYEYYEEEWRCGQIGPEEHHMGLWTFLELQCVQDTIIVWETFEFRNVDKDRDKIIYISREYIGVTKLFCLQRGLKGIGQMPAQGKVSDKSFTRKENLTRLGLWFGASKHAMDATGHLLYYMINGNGIDMNKRLELLTQGWK